MFIEGYIKDNTYIYLNLLNNLKQFNYIKYITINNTLFIENNYKTIHTSFISRTRKGGRFRRFKVLIISGNKNGWVSLGIGKNKYLNEALNQALFNINNNVILIGKNSQGHLNLFNKVKYKKSFILIKQRPLGFGNKGSNVVQNIFELGGVKDVLCKQLGSSNKLNTVKNIFNIFINKNVFKYKKDSIFKIFNYIY
uniref:Ribosomal protein S5 n=1 Tax=Piridium sociabile TaxID=2570542 RepID=A0A5B9XVQ5_9ALVE|nr:ribosomal protein S5 [Piridium sociabile]